MKRIKKLFSFYKFRSIVIRNFTILTVMSLLSAGMFFLFTKNIFQDNLNQSVYKSSMNVLQKTSNSVDSQLESIVQSMSMSMGFKDIVSASIVPNMEHVNRNKNITSYLLRVLTGNNPLIDRAYYYVWEADGLYTSWNTVGLLEEFPERSVIESYKGKRMQNGDTPNVSNEPTILVQDEKIYVFVDFPLNKLLGTMVCEVNMPALFKSVNTGESVLGDEVYVYTENGTPLFSEHHTYPAALLKHAVPDEETGTKISLGNGRYFRLTGKETGWVYLSRIQNSQIHVDNITFFKSFLPFLLLFLGVSFVISLYSTLGIYRPVNSLMESINTDGPPPDMHQNEFDYLHRTYENFVLQNDRHIATIKMVTPAVLKNMFTNLLTNEQPDIKYLNETLSSLVSPFRIDDKYFVTLVEVTHYGGAHLSEMEANLCQVHINQLAEKAIQNTGRLFLTTDKNMYHVLILNFDAETAVIKAKQGVADLCEHLLAQMKSMPYEIMIGKGSVCTNLAGISSAYSDALLMLRTEQYQTTDKTAYGDPEAVKDPQADINAGYLKQRLRVICKCIEGGEQDQANHLMEATIDEFADAATPALTKRRQCERMIDCIVEYMISLKISDEDWSYLNEKGIEKMPEGAENDTVMLRSVKDYCSRALELIDTYTRKRQNKYITATKEYISENYSDSSLSLNAVSEHIGIHSTYLSKLINDALGQHFTSYLNEYRVEIAKQLLAATNQSVTDIGFKTGFNSAQSFIRVFKKHTGLTPGQYGGKMKA